MIRPEVAQTLVDLQGLKERDALPERARHTAERLETRLKTPLRVAIMGPQGSGKSTLLNYVAGGEIVPRDIGLPTLRASYSAHAHASCTLCDGSVLRMPKLDYAQIAEKAPVFVDLRLPLPALRKITLLELVTRDHATEQSRALAWAAQRCDLAIWCTQSFAPHEQAVWNTAPEHLLDQSLLALTKADQIDAETQRALQASGSKRFREVFPVDSLSAIAARDTTGHLDREMLKRSGGLSLIRALLREIDNGIATAHDSALVLLAHHADWAKRSNGRKNMEPPHSNGAFDAPPIPSNAPTPAPKSPPPAKQAKDETKAHRDRSRETMEAARDHLVEQCDGVIAQLDADGPPTPAEMFDTCAETMRTLLDFLSDKTETAMGTHSDAHDLALEGADMIELLRAERGVGAVRDALSVLLQVKRELDSRLQA